MRRRDFLASASAYLAGAAFGVREVRTARIPALARRAAPMVWLPDATSAEALRALAVAAVDAGRSLGAGFVDVRVGEERRFTGSAPTDVEWWVRYHVRALVDGAWGVTFGEILTTDAVVASTREAVIAGKLAAAVNGKVGAPAVELAKAPVVTGEWASPVQVPPLTVPTDEAVRILDAWSRSVDPMYGVTVLTDLRWEIGTHVVATSEGTVVTQHLTRALPHAEVGFAARRHTAVTAGVPGILPVSAGFEVMLAPDVPERIRTVAQTLLPYAVLPTRTFEDAGKYPVVFDGAAMAQLVALTLGQGLDGDRVVGYEADAAGRSFLDPGAGGASELSPLVTVRADREVPAYTAIQWDDEGVASTPTTLIDKGQVREYLTTRETAAALGRAGSGGFATLPLGASSVMAGGGRLVLAPAAGGRSLDELLRGVTHGLLVLGGSPELEPGVASGVFNAKYVLEVRNGKPVAHVRNAQPIFATRQLWRSQLRALGDASTVFSSVIRTPKGMPWQRMTQVVSTPAALFADVDVVRTDL